jgi:UDP-N-acetylglucosamine 3-dehydrogenase
MIKVGMIGTGGIAKVHAQSLSKLDNVKITAVYDIDNSRAESFAQDYETKVFPSYEELLDSDVDAVYICSPPFVHKEHAVAAAEAKKDIFCEKPIEITLDEANEILEAVEKNGIRLMMGYVLRYFPAFKTIRDMFTSGELGDLVTSWSNRYSYFAPVGTWVADPDLSGGMTVEFFTHDLDWHRWVGGEVKTVYGKIAQVNPEIKIETNISSILTFENGTGLANGSWASPLERVSIGVTGTKGGISYEAGQLRMKLISDKMGRTLELPSGEDPYLQESRHFIDCLAKDEKPDITAEDGFEALKIALAIQESSRTGKVVDSVSS